MSKRQLNFRIEEDTFRALSKIAEDMSKETKIEVTVSDVARIATASYAHDCLKKNKK
jgi:hypothetical protein